MFRWPLTTNKFNKGLRGKIEDGEKDNILGGRCKEEKMGDSFRVYDMSFAWGPASVAGTLADRNSCTKPSKQNFGMIQR